MTSNQMAHIESRAQGPGNPAWYVGETVAH